MRFEGLKRVNPEFLASRKGIEAGDVVDSAAISREAQRMSVLQDFDSVGYRLDGDPSAPTLTWLPREKNWGPNYLRADLGVYTSLQGDLTFALYARHARTWINSLGAEWRNEVQIGEELRFATGIYQPLDRAQRLFVEPRLAYSRTYENLFADDERVARYQFRDTMAQLEFGFNIGRYAQARVGYLYDERKVEVDIGTQLLPEGQVSDAGLIISAEYDSRDTAFAPTRGITAALEYLSSNDSLGGDRNWERAEMGLGVAVPLRRDVLWVTAAGGTKLSSDLPADRFFSLGGPNSFPGYELGEVRVGGYWTMGTSYLWNFKEVLPIRNLALYAGVGLVGGAIYDRLDAERRKAFMAARCS